MTGFLTVGVWTLGSRILGFVRDIAMAAFLGAGPVAEAFLVAFSLPNMFRRFFAEGAFNTAFVPLFSKKLEADGDAKVFAQDAFSGLAAILVALTLVATIGMPWLVLAMASGFSGDERFDLAVQYGRIAFVYILLISLAALFSGVLNATGRFAAAAAAPDPFERHLGLGPGWDGASGARGTVGVPPSFMAWFWPSPCRLRGLPNWRWCGARRPRRALICACGCPG